ncbi:MAG: GFA family protein [Reinekea sp.]|jgi:hypothetical protein
MTNTIQATGCCLCGAVQIKVTRLDSRIGVCHCNRCRRWGGGPLMAVDCKEDVIFGGEAFISTYSSSEWAERGFCKQCGTHLFFVLKESKQYHIPVGIFGSDIDLTFDHQIFIDKKPSWYNFAEQTRNMTEAEVIG